MAVYLEGSLNRYLGLSTDTKPTTIVNGQKVPAGSSFLETDTSRLYRWNGTTWALMSSAAAAGGIDLGAALTDLNVTLLLVLRELRIIRQIQEVQNEIDANELESGELIPA